MYGIDISSYQRGIHLNNKDIDFIIMKATEGKSYIDGVFYENSLKLKDSDKLIGCYHFARPDLNSTTYDMEQEADFFIETVKKAGLLNKAILVLDWETEPTNREDLAQAWVMRVESKTGIVPFIYGSRSKLVKYKDWFIMKHCPLWVALWPQLGTFDAGNPINMAFPNRNDINWTIWQYTSKGKYPGFNYNVDLDYCSCTPEQWKRMAGYKDEEVISKEMEWAIEKGLIVGYGNGKYGPNDNLTRDQLASVLYRYNKFLNDKIFPLLNS